MKKKIDFFQAILANQTAIANAFGIDIPSPVIINSTPRLNPLKLLPPELTALLTDAQAFLNAFEGDNPILSVKNGMIVSNINSDTLHPTCCLCCLRTTTLSSATITPFGKAEDKISPIPLFPRSSKCVMLPICDEII